MEIFVLEISNKVGWGQQISSLDGIQLLTNETLAGLRGWGQQIRTATNCSRDSRPTIRRAPTRQLFYHLTFIYGKIMPW
jgi:hypothetical protein